MTTETEAETKTETPKCPACNQTDNKCWLCLYGVPTELKGEEIGFLVASQSRWKELEDMDAGWNVLPATRDRGYCCIGTKIANADRKGSTFTVPADFEATCDYRGYMIPYITDPNMRAALHLQKRMEHRCKIHSISK